MPPYQNRRRGRAVSMKPPPRKVPYKIVINEVTDVNGDGRVDLADVEWLIKNRKNVLTKLEGDGITDIDSRYQGERLMRASSSAASRRCIEMKVELQEISIRKVAVRKMLIGIGVVVGLLLGVVAASDDVRQALDRAGRFEHADDRRGALEAFRVRKGISREQWALNLFDAATNGNNRLLLQDLAGYATTNALPQLRRVVEDAGAERKFRMAAFRVYATVDGFGERTLSVVQARPAKTAAESDVTQFDLIRQLRLLLPTNDVRRTVIEQRLTYLSEKDE